VFSKKIGLTTLLAIVHIVVYAQFYIRGEIKNERGETLQNVRIVVHSTQFIYYSGVDGEFGITSSKQFDSLTLSCDNYEPFCTKINASSYTNLTLKFSAFAVKQNKHQLISFIKDSKPEEKNNWSVADETYTSLVENPFILTEYSPSASFSANINRASYSNIRRFLNMGTMVPPDGVRIEEMLNNFSFGYKEPEDTSVFNCSSQLSSCPWNSRHQLLFLNISARKLNMEKVPPSNLVFLIDASGSMDLPNKLPLLKSGFRLLVKNLRDIDTVSIVTYGDMVHIAMEGVSGCEKDSILKVIEELEGNGPTPGEAGLRLAYEVVRRRFIKGGNNRIILASDGDFNVGLTTENQLENLIEQQKKSGIYLTCLGVGMGNYKDSKLSVLAQKGNGNFAYIDNEQEAEKILMTELTQTLFAVADNVHLNVDFQSPSVMEYRLIGFDNKKAALADSTSKLEGGEIGSGHSLMALFELIPKSDSGMSNPTVAVVKVSYQLPGKSTEHNLIYSCPDNFIPFATADCNLRKATSIAMFGMKLKGSTYSSLFSWDDIQFISANCFSRNDFISNDYLNMIAKAKKIYEKKKNKHLKL
jgi:Ca-activated chloride channel family protein